MRVVLVGPPALRQEIRRRLAGSGLEIAGEADTLADARGRRSPVDGFLIAASATPARDGADTLQPLTAREADVLALLGRGRSNKAIAAALGISDQTVKFHVASICGKLDAHNRTEAVRIAIDRGLIAV